MLAKATLSALTAIAAYAWSFETTAAQENTPISRPGCIRQPIATCIASLQGMITPGQVPDSDGKIDVNGKRVGGKEVFLDGDVINMKLGAIYLTLGTAKRVKKITAQLMAPIEDAQTITEYDATNVYEITEGLLGSACMPERLQFYRFIHNKLKGKLGRTKRTTEIGIAGAAVAYSRSANNVKLCGAHLSLTNESGVDTRMIDDANSTGSYDINTLTIR